MKDDRYDPPIDPPRTARPTPEQVEQWAIEDAERRLKEEPFAWEETMTKITSVEVRDIKRVEYVRFAPNGAVTIVGGKNAAGKSSFLDAIAYCLGGKKLCPSKPIRTGQEKALVSIHLDGDADTLLPACVVTRRFSRNGDAIISELEIKSDDGYLAPTPQGILNSLLSTATFDPLAFTRLKPKEQAEALRELIGLDPAVLDDLEANRAKTYATRTAVNAEVRNLSERLSAMPEHPEAPVAEVIIKDLVAELERRQVVNRDCDAQVQKAEILRQNVEKLNSRAIELEAQFEHMRRACDSARQDLTTATEVAERESARAVQAERADAEEIRLQISQAEDTNQQVRANAAKAALVEELLVRKVAAIKLTEQLAEYDATKAKWYQEAKWPVEGLGFNEEGVTFGGLPFEQASSGEELEVSVAMGFAMNPKLKILVIRDGSLLDQDSLARVVGLAEKHEGHIFLERVGEGGECHLLLRDGKAAGQRRPVDFPAAVDPVAAIERETEKTP